MQRSPSVCFKLTRTVGLGLVHGVRTRQRILLGKAVVASNIELISCVLAARREVKSPPGGIGQRVKGQEVQRLLSQPVLRNDIARERIADGLARATGVITDRGGVVKRGCHGGEVPAAHRRRRNRRVKGLRPPDARSLIVAEYEGAILAAVNLRNGDRTTDGKSELVLFNRGADTSGIEKVARVENLVADKFESASVHAIRSRPERRRYDRGSLPVFGGERIGLDGELLNRIDRRHDRGNVEILTRDAPAVDHEYRFAVS